MPDIDFSALRQRLYEQGVATGYAERLVAELREHRVDLEAERLVAGDSRAEAAVRAGQQLGSDAAIAAQVLARPELRGRWSSVRAALRPLQSIGIAGVYGSGGAVAAPALARWTASISLGAVATVVMLFALARTIAIGF